MGRYSPGEHSEVHFKNFQPTLCGWSRPKLLKIAFLQMCRMMSCEVSIGSYSPGEHSDISLRKLQPRPHSKMLQIFFFSNVS